MKRLIFYFAVIVTLNAARPAAALTLSTGLDSFGATCDTVQWTDASGLPRKVWLGKGTPGGFVTNYTYYAGPTHVTATPASNGMSWPFLVLVNHWHPDSGGDYVTSAGLASNGTSSYTQNVTVSQPFVGAHHLVWRATFRLKADPADASKSFYNNIDYFFQDGRDDFVWSTAYDVSAWAEGTLESDNRSPYGDFDWDGNGSTLEPISGIGWGTKFKFRTTEAPLSSNSNWDYNQANTIPYIWQWKDAGLGDREFGVVQNQPYVVQNMGSELHIGTCSSFTNPPSTGTAMPTNGCQAAQQNGYAAWTGQRFTWGSTYKAPAGWGVFCPWADASCGKGPFENGHGETFAQHKYGAVDNNMSQYPINAWSMNIHLGRYSTGGLQTLVDDTATAYGCTLTASVGTVVLTGPRGPGTFTSTGTMPSVTYTRPGLDFVKRSWRVTTATGAANVTLTVPAAGLKRPTFSFEGLSSAPCQLQLNTVTQTEGVDYNSSFGGGIWYVTFIKDLAAGANQIVIPASCGTPTFTPTATLSQTAGGPSNTASPSATRSATISPTSTATPSATAMPACSTLLVDNLEDGNGNNPLGGAWSTWASAPASTSAFSVVAGYPSSPYGTVGAARSTGTNSGAQVGSISTAFSPAQNMGSKDRLIFWINATAGSTSFRVNVQRAAVVDFDHFGASFTAPAGAWTRIELPLASMTQAGWGATVPMAWNDVTGLTFYNNNVGAYSLTIDDISFDCPGPTPTYSSTRSSSPTRSATATITPSSTDVPVGSSPTTTPTPLTGPAPCAADNFGSFLLANDKIVFLGDSIVYRGNFTDMMQKHLTERYPSAGFTFANAGIPGEAGLQVWNRRAAVLALNPDVILISLGTNDAFDLANYQTDFPNYITQLVTYFQSNGVRVALITPGIVDLTAPNALPADYNTRLQWIANWVMTYAASNSLPAYNINAAMAAANTAMKADLSGSCMIPDGIHPDPAGGWVTGLGALKALGVPDRCGEIVFNSGIVTASSPLAASGATSTGFDIQLNTLPPVPPAAARKILPYTPLQAQVNHLGLQATGLSAANYYIVIDGHRNGPVTSGALVAGINLYDYWTAPASSASEWHHVEFLDASGQPAYVCDSSASDGLIDDFEMTPVGQWLDNRWAGDIWGLDPGSGTSTVSPLPAALAYTVPGYGGTGSCMRINGNADSNFPPVLISYLNGLNSDVKQGIRFMAKGIAGKQVRFQIHSWAQKRMGTESWNDYGFIFTFAATDVWQQVSIPYTSLVLPSWGPTPFYPFVPQEIYNLDWLPVTAGAFDIAIDNIEFYCTTAMTPTSTRTTTPSYSPSSTRTPSASPTVTLTPSFSPTVTPSPTETNYLGTPTSTETGTVSPTITLTVSTSPSLSASPSVSVSGSPTSSRTASVTATVTATATMTPSTVPGSFTSTATHSASATRTATPSSSASASPTATGTSTCTSVILSTATFSSTMTPTSTHTPPAAAASATTVPAEGPLEVLQAWPLPNPNPGTFQLLLAGPADLCRIRVYSAGMTCLADLSAVGGVAGGWLSVDARSLNLANGTYYFEAWAERGGRRSLKPQVGKLLVLH